MAAMPSQAVRSTTTERQLGRRAHGHCASSFVYTVALLPLASF